METTAGTITSQEREQLTWLLSETFEPTGFSSLSFLDNARTEHNMKRFVEVGPRMNFRTAWSSNAAAICEHCGLKCVGRIERSRRYLLHSTTTITKQQLQKFSELVHDRMTEQVYDAVLTSFGTAQQANPVRIIPLMEGGKDVLRDLSNELGLGFDNWDIEYYNKLFVEDMKRNPTDCEVFDMAQSNSEHSRHWYFGGKMVIDGKEIDGSLFKLVKATLPKDKTDDNSVIAFHDNSSAIRGYPMTTILPSVPGQPCAMAKTERTYHPILTAETHNFPTGVAPFNGAETGTGGRIRDVQSTGRGALTVAGISAYCVGNLQIPGYALPWEDASFQYPSNLASPLQIEIQGSNGASDYGNKYGEPVVAGFTRSFGKNK